MNPSIAGLSELRATCGSAQVGYANVFGFGNAAGIWFGTPESFVNLGELLPPGVYFESVATSVAELNGTFYVGGYASLAAGGGTHAFLWVGVPSPGAVWVLAGACALAGRRCREPARVG